MAHAFLYANHAGWNPFSDQFHSLFPPGTDQTVIKWFELADQNRNGCIDDKELKSVLSLCNHVFSLRTVHLLIYVFTNNNTRRIGPREFTAVYYGLQRWKDIFEKYDRKQNGKIEAGELGHALKNLGFNVSRVILDLLIYKFDPSGSKTQSIDYDNFIECCLTVKGLSEKFKQREYYGSATFTYENFLLEVLPFVTGSVLGNNLSAAKGNAAYI